MRKFINLSLIFVMIIGVAFGFVGCKKKSVAPTTTDITKVVKSNGVSTNGGVTVVRDGKLYFINGTKTPDETNGGRNINSAIYRVDYSFETGVAEDAEYERISDKLAGFDFGSLHIFGDYLYFTTPGDGINSNGDVLYNKTRFVRYDLKNNTLSTIYTTSVNSSSENLTYGYYVVSNNLYLVVFEKEQATLKSIKVGENSSVIYTIRDVEACVLSELDYQKEEVDADSFIFYTKSAEIGKNAGQNGAIVYKVSPNENNSVALTDGSKDIEIYCIRAGKFIYASEVKYQAVESDESKDKLIYAEKIDNTTDALTFSINNVISYNDFDDSSVIFIEEDDGAVSLLYFNSTSSSVNYIKYVNGLKTKDATIATLALSSSDSVSFVGLTTITETVVEDNTETEDVDETETNDVTYLVYMVKSSGSLKAYKIEFKRKLADGTVTFKQSAKAVCLSTSTFVESSEMMVPEIIGNYLYAFVTNSADEKIYLTQTDLRVSVNSTDESQAIGVEEGK